MEGKKFDTGKSPMGQGLLSYFPRALEYVAYVSQYGAGKYNLDYADKNWNKVENGLLRYTDALLRHVTKEQTGEVDDPESLLLHAGHAAWNALARLELILQQEGNEERL